LNYIFGPVIDKYKAFTSSGLVVAAAAEKTGAPGSGKIPAARGPLPPTGAHHHSPPYSYIRK
jgi:hypothetical protein